MSEFEYRVVTAAGKAVKGTGQASDADALKERLRGEGLSILEIKPLMRVAGHKTRMAFEPFGIPRKALVFFTRQFATTLRAGLPLLRALGLFQHQTTSPGLRKVLSDVTTRVMQGNSLYQAMEPHRRVFGDLYLSLIRVGEASGSLDKTVARLAEILEKDFTLQRRVRGAMAYPLFVLCFSLALVYSLVAFLLPNFEPVFQGAGLDIPRQYPLTQMLINMSRAATNPIAIGLVLLGVIVVVGLFQVAARTRPGRIAIDTLKYHFPLLRGLVEMSTLARFCRTFGLLIKSGVPLLESLDYVAAASGNAYVERMVHKVSHDVRNGEKVSATLARLPMFPPLVVQMATVGEEPGNLDAMFERVAEYYEEELDNAVGSLTALIEPAMMVFIGVVVGVFVMGVLLPILGISAAVQGQI